MSGKGTPAAGRPEPGGHAGSKNFPAPIGPAKSGHLIFLSGASNASIHADPEGPDLCRARFEGRVPTVVVRGGTVTIRYPGFPTFDWLHYRRERPAEVALNAQVPWHLEVRGGAFGATRASLAERAWQDSNLRHTAPETVYTHP